MHGWGWTRLPGRRRHNAAPLLDSIAYTGGAVERRRSKRNPIQVDIEIAHPGAGRCSGYAENISRDGIAINLNTGSVPETQRSVVLNFRIWTGTESLYRKLYARVVRSSEEQIALEFAEADFVADAIVQDLIYYQKQGRTSLVREPASGRHTSTQSPY